MVACEPAFGRLVLLDAAVDAFVTVVIQSGLPLVSGECSLSVAFSCTTALHRGLDFIRVSPLPVGFAGCPSLLVGGVISSVVGCRTLLIGLTPSFPINLLASPALTSQPVPAILVLIKLTQRLHFFAFCACFLFAFAAAVLFFFDGLILAR